MVLILTALVYANSLGNLFVWDDSWSIVDNGFIKSWKNLPLLFNRAYLTSFQDFGFLGERDIGSGEISYRPVATLSYFIDYSLWGLNPFGYHLTNLLLHLFNLVLLYFFAALLTKEKKTPLLAALLFGLHPLNSEAVAVISFREDLLAFLFFIASLICYMKLDAFRGIKKGTIYIASLIFFLLALFSKEMALVLPLILVLYDFYFGMGKYKALSQPLKLHKESSESRQRRDEVSCQARNKPKIYYIGYALVCLLYLWVWAVLMRNPGKVMVYLGGNFFTNLFTMIGIIARYIQWVILPLGIHAVVPDNASLAVTGFTPMVFLSIVLIILLLAFAVKKFKTSKILSFSIFWFFITLLPVSNIVPVLSTIMASRFLYIPLAGFCLSAAVLLLRQKIPSKTTIALIILIIIFYSGLAMQRIRVYKTNTSLWSEMLKYYPQSALAHADMGVVFERNGLLGQAISEYQTAIEIDPGCAKAYFGLGNCYYMQDKLQESLGAYKKGLKLLKSKANQDRAYKKLEALFRGRGL